MLKWISFIIFLLVNSVNAACTPAGTASDDTVICTGVVSGYQYFYGGSDSVTLQNVTGSGIYWLDESTHGNPATDGEDRFYASNSHFQWVFGFGKNDYFEVNSSTFSNLYTDTNPYWVDQRGDDTIIIRNSISDGWIQSGNDNDIIEIYDSNVSTVAAGYSDIYGFDYTPFDGNDTVLLDHVNFTIPNYYYTTLPGAIGTGKGDDTIEMIHGGEAYNVAGGYGNDTITIRDGEHFNACTYLDDSNRARVCGIYSDIEYSVEQNISHDDNYMAIHHGDDKILLEDADIRDIVVNGGHGSDSITIHTPVQLSGATIDGGDDKSTADTFIDQLHFEQWSGDIEGDKLKNWEQIILQNISDITLIDSNISVSSDNGLDASSNLPYGLIIEDNSILNIKHNYLIDGNLHNSATLNLQDGNTPGEILTITSNYTANNTAALYLDVMLNDASPSIADRVVILGNTEGTTTLYIDNINGIGGQTPTGDNAGILLIEVAGNSNALFQLAHILHVGAYTYALHKGSNGNWYLQSKKDTPSVQLIKTVNHTNITKPEILNYNITLKNSGNVTLSSIVMTDILPNSTHKLLTLQSGDSNGNQKLDVGEIWIYSTTYAVSQDEIDKGILLTNKVSLSTAEGLQATSSAQTHILQQSAYSFTKTTNTQPQYIGDCLSYMFSVKNRGNTRLKVNKIIDDNCQSNITLISESSQQNNILDLNEEQVFTCTSLPVTPYEASVCKVINIANVAVKINLSHTLLAEKTSKITTPIDIPNSCTCIGSKLERAPLMPSNNNVLSLSSTSATIHWEDNAFNELGFKIYKDTILIGTVGKNETTFHIDNLKPRTKYTYRVVAYNAYGESYRTIISFTTKDDYGWLPAIYHITL